MKNAISKRSFEYKMLSALFNSGNKYISEGFSSPDVWVKTVSDNKNHRDLIMEFIVHFDIIIPNTVKDMINSPDVDLLIMAEAVIYGMYKEQKKGKK